MPTCKFKTKMISVFFQANLRATFATSSRWKSTRKVLGIPREEGSMLECRAALSPEHVRKLCQNDVKVLVQPSNKRVFPVQCYAAAGAVIQEDLREASVIMGVKQVPLENLLPDKTYCFFSHTTKAQRENMAMLDCILRRNIRLIDYEALVNSDGRRMVSFGRFAGIAGTINILHALGLRLLTLGHHTPFLHVSLAHNYRHSNKARQAVRDAGYEIALDMMPRSIGPLTFLFTGIGNVSQGAREIFEELPHEYVAPLDLSRVAEYGSLDKVYGSVITLEDNHKRVGGEFDREEYKNYPERYYSIFGSRFAPYASVIINGIHWSAGRPKLITIPDSKRLLQPNRLPTPEGSPPLPHRLLAICDISADPGGSIEFMTECTTIDKPFALYDAEQHRHSESFSGPGVLVCSIANMPAQLAIEATDHFGSLLYPYIESILSSDATQPLSEHDFDPVVRKAVIVSNGRLTPKFEYVAELRKKYRRRYPEASKTVLVLGSGHVIEPLVEYITRDRSVRVVVASSSAKEGHCTMKYEYAEHVILDISADETLLDELVENSKLVISLLPYSLHPVIAERCIKHKVNMLTASHLTPEMKDYHKAAVHAGITVVNEVGLDPGIDHMLAVRCFDEVKSNAGKIRSFVSFCGGLPAPEYADNALRYKFTRDPRGVLRNSLSAAKYLEEGEIVEISEGGELMENFHDIRFLPAFNLEGFPNRDSTVYVDMYDIQSADTVLRGTLRYKGFGDVMKALQSVGLLDDEPKPYLRANGPDLTWKQFLCHQLGHNEDDIPFSEVRSRIFDAVGKCEDRMAALESLGILSEHCVEKCSTPLDTMACHLTNNYSLGANERDIVILHHEIGIEWQNGEKEKRIINFILYGERGGYTAMAKCAGYSAAIAAEMLLEDKIQTKGMVLPMRPDIYKPILKRLEDEGLYSFQETIKM